MCFYLYLVQWNYYILRLGKKKKKTYKKLRVGILVYEYVEGVDGKNW
jgi:hypothetical protein